MESEPTMTAPLHVRDIERTLLHVPFREIPERHMRRDNNGWHIVEICRVEADNGLVGWGETLPNYSWGRVTEADVERARGARVFSTLWDDTLGPGLQMALFDLAGKAAGVPVHRLLGQKVRDHCPISWWGPDMAPEDYAAEARAAMAAGHTSFKQKARPWWDVYEQARRTTEEGGRDFKLHFDFNEHLNSAGSALPVLEALDRTPQIWIYESPIPQHDLAGNRRIRETTPRALAMHHGDPPMEAVVRERVADGFLLNCGATQALKAAAACEAFNMPFWFQLVGTGLTTAMAGHLAAVCRMAQWPAVTCMNLYQDTLLETPIAVRGGFYAVPEEPGLGVRFREEALTRWRTETTDCPSHTAWNEKAIYALRRADGRRTWYSGERATGGLWPASRAGALPFFEHGACLETWENDGSREWKELAERTKKGPVPE
jgi:L-alanine-DL-glutamate epimerase-like enolase superfamily enzyme